MLLSLNKCSVSALTAPIYQTQKEETQISHINFGQNFIVRHPFRYTCFHLCPMLCKKVLKVNIHVEAKKNK